MMDLLIEKQESVYGEHVSKFVGTNYDDDDDIIKQCGLHTTINIIR